MPTLQRLLTPVAFTLNHVTRDTDGEPWTRQTTGYECVTRLQDPQADVLMIVTRIGSSGTERDGQIARIDTSHGTVHLHWFGPDGIGHERIDTLAHIPLGHPEAVGFFNVHFDEWYNKMEVIMKGGQP